MINFAYICRSFPYLHLMSVYTSTCEHFRSMLIEMNHVLHQEVFPDVIDRIDSESNFQEYVRRPLEDHLLFADTKAITDCNVVSLNEYYAPDNSEDSSMEHILLDALIDTVDDSILYQHPNSDSETEIVLYNEDFLKEMFFSSTQISICFVTELQEYESTDRDQIMSFLASTEELAGYPLGLLIYAYRVTDAQPSTYECSVLVDKLLSTHQSSFVFLAQGFLKNCDFSTADEHVYADTYQRVNEALKTLS